MKVHAYTLLIVFLGVIFFFSNCSSENKKAEPFNLIAKAQTYISKKNASSPGPNLFQVSVKPVTIPFHIPALQGCAAATYNGSWIFIGGRKAGLHGLDNDPPPFRLESVNDSIWIVDMKQGKSMGVGVPFAYANFLSATNQAYYQVGDKLYLCGGYTFQLLPARQYNWTSDRFFEINLPALMQYVQSGGAAPALSEVFTKVIQSPYVQVTGGEMMVVNNNFYLIGGQNYIGRYQRGNTGLYTNAIRKFNLISTGAGWSITDTSSLIDVVNLHRRDLNLVPVAVHDQDSIRAVIYGGVFTKDGLGYRNPVYISGLANGVPSISIDSMKQDVNQYTCASISAAIVSHLFTLDQISFLGGISYMQYDTLTKKLSLPSLGKEMPFSNLISSIYTDGATNSLEVVQLPPAPALPAYLGSNALFFPLSDYMLSGYHQIMDLDKIFNNYANTPILIGYMYGGIESHHPNTVTPDGNYSTTVNHTLYQVYMNIPVDVH